MGDIFNLGRRARNALLVTLVFFVALSVLFLTSFVLADFTSFAGNAAGNVSTVNEDTYFIVNFTVNNSDGANNITAVNITLLGENSTSTTPFTFGLGGLGTTAANSTFVNSTTTLNWTNGTSTVTESGLINGSQNAYFNFNVSASTPGSYNISVKISTHASHIERNLTIVVNDTSAPGLMDFATTLTPAADSNLSQTFIPVNVSVNDTHTAIDTVIIYLYNTTGLVNSTPVVIGSGLNTSAFVNFTTHAGGTALSSGIYLINFTANDTENNLNSSGPARNITLDSVPPEVYGANITSPGSKTNHSTNSGNYSSTLALNVTIPADTLTGIRVDTVIFNVTNITGEQNGTFIAENLAGDFWNATLDTSKYTDGTYNITAIVNDTLNNINNTALSFTVVFDNTSPDVTLSCTPDPVAQDSTITCSCDTSDVTSGINESATENTANPSTSQTGVFSVECTAQDHAQNVVIAGSSYTVTSSGNSGGGSSSGGSSSGGSSSGDGGSSVSVWKKTFVEDAIEFSKKEMVEKELGEDERVRIKIGSQKHHIGVKSISSDKVTVEISSSPQTAELSVGQTEKFELTEDDFYDISVTLESIANGKASLDIMSIHEPGATDAGDVAEPDTGDTGDDEVEIQEGPEFEESGSAAGWIIGIIILIIVVVVVIVYLKKRNR